MVDTVIIVAKDGFVVYDTKTEQFTEFKSEDNINLTAFQNSTMEEAVQFFKDVKDKLS